MENQLKVLMCGTEVNLHNNAIKGRITCQSIRFGKVQYEITYLNNGKFETYWANELEFTSSGSKQKIGFI